MANFNELATQTVQRLMQDLNITYEQASGIVGQLAYESDGLQAINERSPVVKGSRGGFGWAQWTGPRRRDFENWAGGKGLDVTDPAANYGFLLHELTETPESRVLDQVRKADNAKEAGQIFTEGYLRPGIVAQDKRDSWVDRVMGVAESVMNAVVPSAQAADARRSTADRIKASREAGYSDQEIINFLKERPEFQDRMRRSVEAGYSEDEVFKHLGLSIEAPDRDPAALNRQPIPEEGSSRNLLYNEDRGFLGDLSHQAQLMGRYLVEGVASLPEMIVNPIASAIGAPPMRASDFLDAVGVAKPEGATERIVGEVARSVAGTALPLGMAAASPTAIGRALSAEPTKQLTAAAGAGAGSGIAEESGAPAWVQAGAALGGGLIGGAMGPSSLPRTAPKSVKENIKTLKDASEELYTSLKTSGRVATPDQTSQLYNESLKLLNNEGIIIGGKVSKAYPKIRDVVTQLRELAGEQVDASQLQTIRKSIGNAAGSIDKAERRLGTMLKGQFDDVYFNVAPEAKEANRLYSAAMKGELLSKAREAAEASESGLTQSGFENALRREYGKMDKKMARGMVDNWTPEEVKAIQNVTRGSNLGNFLRKGGNWLSPNAITSPVGAATIVSNPAAALPVIGGYGVGIGMKRLATNMTNKNALLAEQLTTSIPGYTGQLINNTPSGLMNSGTLGGTVNPYIYGQFLQGKQ